MRHEQSVGTVVTVVRSLWWDRFMYLATTDAANGLLARDPLALLIGMLLD